MTSPALPYQDHANFMHFYEISKIPRPSFYEAGVADYVESFAKEHDLWYNRDSLGNIIIKKQGTLGREGEAPVILQAHMDMVCVKTPQSAHDFTKDPIDIYVEDGWMKARGTTLGADDGAGVANILAILGDESVAHPPLECIFTVQEEDGMGGAKNLDYSLLESQRMIGLDGVDEGTTIYSAASVYAGNIEKNLKYDNNTNDFQAYKLSIKGLASGHGALKIGNEQANAIKVSARILHELNRVVGISLADITGGSLVHIIPYECESVFAVKSDIDSNRVYDLIETTFHAIKDEFAATDENMVFAVEEMNNNANVEVLDKECSDSVIDLLFTIPAGTYKRNCEDLSIVEGSWNVSVVKMANSKLLLTDVSRANHPVSIDHLRQLVGAHALSFGGEYVGLFDYMGYHIPDDSKLTLAWEKIFEEMSGKKFKRIHMHGGLDAGTIYHGLGGIDVIVIMPTVRDVHTPEERMDVESFKRSYEYLKAVLKNI